MKHKISAKQIKEAGTTETYSHVDAVLEEAQSRCSARKIEAADLLYVLKKAEKQLLLISRKKDAIGTKMTVDYNGQRFPNSYRYTPESTWIEAVYTASGWAVTRIYRDKTASTDHIKFELTDATKQNLADRMSDYDWR